MKQSIGLFSAGLGRLREMNGEIEREISERRMCVVRLWRSIPEGTEDGDNSRKHGCRGTNEMRVMEDGQNSLPQNDLSGLNSVQLETAVLGV